MKSTSSPYGNSIALKAGKTADLKGQDIRKRMFLRNYLKTASPQSSLILVDGKRPQVVEKPTLAQFGIEIEGASIRLLEKRPAMKGLEGRKVVFISGNKELIKEASHLKDNADVGEMDTNNNAFLLSIVFRPSTTKPVISFIQVDANGEGHMLTYSGRSYANYLGAAEILQDHSVILTIPDISIEDSLKRDPRPTGIKLGNMGITSPKNPETKVTKAPVSPEAAQPAPKAPKSDAVPPAPAPLKGPMSLDDLPAYVPNKNKDPIVQMKDGKAPPTSKLRPKPVKAKKTPSIKDVIESIQNTDTTAAALEVMNGAKIKTNADCRKALIAALQVKEVSDSTLNRIANMGGNVERGFAEFDASDIQEYITPDMLYIVEDTDGIKTLIEDLDDIDNASGYERGYVFWLLLYKCYDDVHDYLTGLKQSGTELAGFEFLQMAVGYGMLEQDQADEIEDNME